MEYYTARKIAEEVHEILAPHSQTINIVGKLRRKKPEVNEIEIICIPKILDQQYIFGHGEPIRKECFEYAVKSLPGEIYFRKPNGSNISLFLDRGLNLNLFMSCISDYYRQLAIRTGSVGFTYNVLTNAWVDKGWVETVDGLRKRSECWLFATGWRCDKLTPALPPIWESEEHLFDWLGVKWIEPCERNV